MNEFDRLDKTGAQQMNEAFRHFKRDSEELVKALAQNPPSDVEVTSNWTDVYERCHDSVKVTLQGKRSGHGGRATRGGRRDPVAPIRIRLQGPNNPIILTLLEYVNNMTCAQLEPGYTPDRMVTKLLQIDGNLTARFQFERFLSGLGI
ncbi:hypothetical protein N0V90_012749 [Kalmusia sp. IMI 367209]|nr:hypothetical protein N0V90_012749 [Kalmusia sp. IMI 367209]